jgi:putative ABC transport system substrate-binding protein
VLQFAASSALLSAALARAQPRTYRIGYLAGGKSDPGPFQEVFFGRLGELGYREGRNLVVERRFADGRLDRLPALAAELVALKPDALFAVASQAALAAARATTTIAIVFMAVPDPVGLGIVKTLARPGTNATGLSFQNLETQAKRLQLLKETFPPASDVAVLHNPLNTWESSALAVLQTTSKTLALKLRVIEIKSPEEIAQAFQTLQARRPDVVYVIESPLTFSERKRIVELANNSRLATVYGLNEFAEAGGLMSYSPSLIEHYRLAPVIIDKILKGAKPADLPVEQPLKFEFLINLKTARTLGIKIPQSVLLRADRVIE